jgi:hypothetical protein
VLAGTLRLTTEELRSLLTGLLEEARFQDRGEFKLADGSGPPPTGGVTDDLIGLTLESLLGYIGIHKSDGLGARYVDTAIALARRCKDARPTTVTGLFNAVDRELKRRGNKHKVLEAANLTIEATGHNCRTDEDVRRKAKALICGRSWVLQRIGRLDEAMADAKKSLNFGQRIGWDRNTAFCNKCIGRIYRRQAEKVADAQKKADLINKSIESLKD